MPKSDSLLWPPCTDLLAPAFRDWLISRKDNNKMVVKEIPFSDLSGWNFDRTSGNLIHESGRFFTIEGLDVQFSAINTLHWQQPIIKQPEIGILGFLTRIDNQVRKFLVQAKMEPGNLNTIQISPTLQATHSNYSAVHKGKVPPYLEYFLDSKKQRTVLCDRLQSEQGARFFRKRNRNMIVEIDHDPELFDDFYWLSYSQLTRLFKIDNFINMDSRSVLSNFFELNPRSPIEEPGSPNLSLSNFKQMLKESSLPNSHSQNTIEEVQSIIDNLRTHWTLSATLIPLRNILAWQKTDNEIHHIDQSHFSIVAVDVKTNSREVSNWTQPILKDPHLGLIAFICQVLNDVLHFLIQVKVECGNRSIVEIAPTVACSNYLQKFNSPNRIDFLDLVINSPKEQLRFEETQSDEGGRFFQVQNLHKVIEIPEDFQLELPTNFVWVTMNQLMRFQRNSALNIDARSMLARLVASTI